MEPYVGPTKRYDTVLEAYVHSPQGYQRWQLHKHGNVPLERDQHALTPIQRDFLLLAAHIHEPDPDDHDTDIPSSPSSVSHHSSSIL